MNIDFSGVRKGFLLTTCTLAVLCGTQSCQSSYRLTVAEGQLIKVDSTWDKHPDAEAEAMVLSYKNAVDSIMNRVIGVSTATMEGGFPEGLLSNLVADVLRNSATQVLGKPADMGLVNLGGLRNILPQGTITCGKIYEILPFENSLCVVTLRGADMKRLFEHVAAARNGGVSGVTLRVTNDRKLVDATIAGKPVDDEALYTVATIDYLADGNDHMEPLAQAVQRTCPDGATLRSLFMNYVEQQTAAGQKITSALDGRITQVPN